MKVNPCKCFHIKFTIQRNPFSTQYNISGETRKEVLDIRDLGVVVGPKLKFSVHLNSTLTAAYKSLGFILRNGKQLKNVSTTYIITI